MWGRGELVLPTMGGAVLTSHQRPNHITMSTVTPTITDRTAAHNVHQT
jgi:hypothetical protein